LDSSLVSNKNLSEILRSCGLTPGPGNLSQSGQKPTTLMMSLTKRTKPKNNYFIGNSKTHIL